MTFGIRRVSVPGADYRWLGSAHGTSDADTGTIDVSTLTPQTDYPNGYIPSGFAVGPDGSGKYEPFNSSTHDKVRFVLEPVPVDDDDVIVALVWHGEINNDFLPFPLDATGITKAEAGQFTINEEGGS